VSCEAGTGLNACDPGMGPYSDGRRVLRIGLTKKEIWKMRRCVCFVCLLVLIGCRGQKNKKEARKEEDVNQDSSQREEPTYTDYGPEAGRGPESRTATRPRGVLARPTRRQIEFMDLELGMFIHFGLNTFTGQQHGDGKEPPSRFEPANLDCDQWARVAKSMGARYVVFTARHEGGFCLWPTKTTDYSVRNSPWKGGKGDLVREFVDACRKYDLKVGLYHSSSFDAHHRKVLRMGDKDFLEVQLAQLTELLTNYGPIEYMWFDHHGGGEFWEAVDKTVARLQPDCLRFGPDVWITGGHTGVAEEVLWCAVDTATGRISDRPTTVDGEPWGQYFRVWEANTTGNGRWFWHDEETPTAAPLAELLEKYDNSVGRGANLLLNFAPDPRGQMPDDVVARAKEFGDEIRRRFARPIAEAAGKGNVVTIDLTRPTVIDQVVVMEDLAGGQRIAEHCIEALVSGQWRQVAAGRTVGHKRIYTIEPVAAAQVRFRCSKSIVEPVEIRNLAVYQVGKD